MTFTALARFQFHEGPIKTVEKSENEARGSAFQFHEGPIKTSMMRRGFSVSASFNSMKVRLKPSFFDC